MPNAKRLVVCADDYGFTPGVSRAIRELLAARRISATSVMTVSEFWPGEAAALKAVAGDADIGLHLTLTDQRALGPIKGLAEDGRLPPMPALYKAAIQRWLPLPEIRAELDRQIAAFVSIYGRPPDHIDGHHHVHQLPGIRDLVIEAAANLPRQGRPTWVRCCYEAPSVVLRRGIAPAKALFIGSFGLALRRRAVRRGVATNAGFSGAYDYTARALDPRALFRAFVAGGGDNMLVMCHPGYVDAVLAARDGMLSAREAEVAYLAGPDWPALLEANELDLGPLRR